MLKRLLLQSQKNEIFRILRANGLNPNDFEFAETDSVFHHDITGYRTVMGKVNTVKSRKRADYFIDFDIDDNGVFELAYRPAYKNSTLTRKVRGNWGVAISAFNEWIILVKKEFAESDYWAEFPKYQFMDDEISDDTTNELFTTPQIEQIATGLDGIHAYLSEQAIKNIEQDRFVKDNLNYLKELSRRSGRRDWYLMCIGTIVNIATTLAMEPEKAKPMWQIMKAALSGIYRFLLPP